MMRNLFVLLVLSVSCATACSSPPDGTSDNNAPPENEQPNNEPEPTGPTYHADIRPLIDDNCIGCHDAGGIGPFELNSYENVSGAAAVALAAIEDGTMPPWQPAPACRDMHDDRILSLDEVETFRTWVDNGKPEGDEANYEPTESVSVVDLGEPDIAARPSGPFTPTVENGDDYRCFVLDAEFAEDTFVTALNVDPGNRSLVHHSNMFVVNSLNVETVQKMEAEHPEPGYPCFGDPGVSTVNLIGAWVPGMEAVELPEDHAVRIPAGAKIVMQTHYNSVYADLAEVSQVFQMWTRDTPPSKVVRAMPLANLNFAVPAGESESVHTMNVQNLGENPWRILGAAAHLHLLATRVKVEVLRDDDACLLDIPQWDFDWQQAYFYEPDSRTSVEPGETVRLTCTFDNSPENQPQVDGMRVQPRQVTWGGETFDEMCLAFLIVAEDYEPTPEGAELCDEFKSCRETCDDPYGIGCVFNCAVEENSCGECLIFGAQDCAQRHCPDELRAAAPCLFTCAQGAQAGGDIDQCLRDECPTERDDLEVCMRPALESGLCNEDLRSCNVEL